MKKTLAILLLVTSGAANATIAVTDSLDSDTLAGLILGSGITINSSSYLGDPLASGSFTGGDTAGIGMDTGIILTSGLATNALGPNDDGAISENNSGDTDLGILDDLITQGTNDTAVLTIDFSFSEAGTGSADLFFNYVFGSEEYNEYVDSSFNDVFALFVDGVNIAIAPDSNAVSINNVNCGNPFSGVGPNCSSFNNNEGGVFDIQYDGFTDVLLATTQGTSIAGLDTSIAHTLQIAIADAGDSALDSGVFIQGGTLSDTTPTDPIDPIDPIDPSPVPNPSSLLLVGLGLLGMRFARRS